MKTSTPKKISEKERGPGFLLTLLSLMAVSLGVWAYFLYFTPLADVEFDDSFIPIRHGMKANILDAIDTDLESAGSIDNSSDISAIEDAFR